MQNSAIGKNVGDKYRKFGGRKNKKHDTNSVAYFETTLIRLTCIRSLAHKRNSVSVSDQYCHLSHVYLVAALLSAT
jgi:hypothetical protein